MKHLQFHVSWYNGKANIIITCDEKSLTTLEKDVRDQFSRLEDKFCYYMKSIVQDQQKYCYEEEIL
ncbi:MAG: hypothetical protein LBP57_03160 [Endomicrobium sp.]|jgi:hypothetical protein|nr:hypothetical protein [Endomicrobium sp.]